MVPPSWLDWVRRLQTIGRAGNAYSKDPYDLQRFAEVERIAAEILAHHSERDAGEVLSVLRLESGYPTPKVDVRAVVFDAERILLVRERSDGRWSLPGGWADLGEAAGSVAAREVLEESGFEVRTVKLLAVFDMLRHDHPPQLWHVYKLFFSCELLGGSSRTSHETSDVGWFEAHALPPLSVDRNTEGQLKRMFQHRTNPDWPTDFD
jgi:ADP-ribose pyrophosphatase YjhB (NUDIX family)